MRPLKKRVLEVVVVVIVADGPRLSIVFDLERNIQLHARLKISAAPRLVVDVEGLGPLELAEVVRLGYPLRRLI